MPLLEMRQISKSYHGVPVLHAVDLAAEGGEVHALVGENGAGKSTLMKVLGGAVRAEQGSIRLGGELVEIPSPHVAQQLGVAVIHQELLLAPSLDAAENIFLGRTPSRGRVFVDRRTLYERAEAVLAELGADLDVRVPLRRLTVAQRQMVAIARALSIEARIVVMDEPSAVLTQNELERLFEAIGRLCARGVAVVYISHRLDEVFQLAAKVTVLKDGRSQGTHPIGELTRAKVIRLMVGRDVEVTVSRTDRSQPREVLRVEGMRNGRRVRGCDFALRQGEVLGIAGLVGAGRTELARAIVGADKREAGQVYVEGRPVRIGSPAEAIRHGIAYISEDRKTSGIFPELGVADNVLLPAYDNASRWGVVGLGSARRTVSELVRRLDVRAADLSQRMVTLSGGNQQKVVLARWLNRQARIFIFDEPTRGIDVLAKEHIYGLMSQLIEGGASIVMISSELPELLAMSDRILAMREGLIVGEIARTHATEERVLAMCMGQAHVA